MNNNNVRQIGYEQTEIKTRVNIYGLDFEVESTTKEFMQNLESFKNSNPQNVEDLYKALDIFLGTGAADRINDKRLADGYNKLSILNIIAIINCVVEASMADANKPLQDMGNLIYKVNSRGNRKQRRGR